MWMALFGLEWSYCGLMFLSLSFFPSYFSHCFSTTLPLVQSLLAALGSVQFVSNIAFAYFVLNKMVSVKYVDP